MTDPVPSKGCGDNSCIHGRPSGMGTNGGCSCEQRPSKDQLPEHLRDPMKVLDRGERMCALMDEINADCGSIRVAGRFVDLQDEVERLRTTLTGISTCSTCEACRGAALRALGGEAPAARKPDKFDLAFEIMRQLDAENMETMQSCQFGYVMRVTRERAAQPPGAG
jgi:hypothetical protein